MQEAEYQAVEGAPVPALHMTSPAEAGLSSTPYNGLSSPVCMAALGRVLDADPAFGGRAAHEQDIGHFSSLVNIESPNPCRMHRLA